MKKEIKMKTNMKCPNCKNKLIPTEDFFIWKCSKCNWKFILQCDVIKENENNRKPRV